MNNIDKNSENTSWDDRLFIAVNNDVYLPEVFKSLRSRILYPGDDSTPPKTVMVTSVTPGEGKSFVTVNLGISLAKGMDQYSLLVDCDLRRPTLGRLLGMEVETGLADYLAGKREIPELIRKTPINKLSIMASGKPPKNPAELLSSARMKQLVEELADRYEDRIIIFDTPPARVASESIVLAQQVDAVILVVRERGARREDVQKIISMIGREKILGIVFNAQSSNFLEKSMMRYSAGNYYQPAEE